MRKKTATEFTWVLPKRAPTPLNLMGSDVHWKKVNSKTTKKVTCTFVRNGVKPTKHASAAEDTMFEAETERNRPPRSEGMSGYGSDKMQGGNRIMTRRIPPHVPKGPRQNYMDDEVEEESPRPGKVPSSQRYSKDNDGREIKAVRPRESPLDKPFEKPGRGNTDNEVDDFTMVTDQQYEARQEEAVGGGTMKYNDRTVSFAEVRHKDVVATSGVPVQQVEEAVGGGTMKYNDRTVSFAARRHKDVVATSGVPVQHVVQAMASPEKPVPMPQQQPEAHETECHWNDLLEGVFGKPQICAHCKEPFSYFEKNVQDIAFESPCKVTGYFHRRCNVERAVIKKRKKALLATLVKLRMLRGYRMQSERRQEQSRTISSSTPCAPTPKKPIESSPPKYSSVAKKANKPSTNRSTNARSRSPRKKNSTKHAPRRRNDRTIEETFPIDVRLTPTNPGLVAQYRDQPFSSQMNLSSVESVSIVDNEMITQHDAMRFQSLMDRDRQVSYIDTTETEPIHQRNLLHFKIVATADPDEESRLTEEEEKQRDGKKRGSIVARLFAEKNPKESRSTTRRDNAGKNKRPSSNGRGRKQY